MLKRIIWISIGGLSVAVAAVVLLNSARQQANEAFDRFANAVAAYEYRVDVLESLLTDMLVVAVISDDDADMCKHNGNLVLMQIEEVQVGLSDLDEATQDALEIELLMPFSNTYRIYKYYRTASQVSAAEVLLTKIEIYSWVVFTGCKVEPPGIPA